MCGFLGFVGENTSNIQKNFENAFETINHRGPDSSEIYRSEKYLLGFKRLAIIDLDGRSNQPYTDGENFLLFNGEIYNYKDLKKELKDYTFKTNSDSEVILAAYQKWGKDCLRKLNGMFSFVIYDKDRQTLFGARDPFGIKPFYYQKSDDFFIFSSEIKGIVSSDKIKARLNEAVFYDFVAFNRTDHLEDTCFKEIKNLRPGCYLHIDIEKKDFIVERWHFNSISNESALSFNEQKNLLKEKLVSSIKLHLISDVEVGSALSGGIDSSTIVSFIRELDKNRRIHIFSAVYDNKWEKNEKKYVDEVVKEKKLSAHYVYPKDDLLLKDLEKLIYQQEEPFASASIFAGWMVYKKTAEKKIKVLLNGQGADEVFGYDYMAAYYFKELFLKLKWITLFRELYFFSTKQASVGFTLKLFGFLVTPSKFRNKILKYSNKIVNQKFFQRYNSNSDFNKRFFNVKSLNESAQKHVEMKLHHLLRAEDKNSMMFGVEARVPFLEKDLVNFALNTPSKFKVQKGSIKHILKEAAKNVLPKVIYNRNNKIGYETPMGKWMRSEFFQKEIKKMLESSNQPMKKYLNLIYIKKIWEKHMLNKGDFSSEIWKYFYLTKWYNIYFK